MYYIFTYMRTNIIIDDDLREIGPSIDLLFKNIKEIHQEKIGPKVKINVKEVKEIPSEKNKPSPLIISKLQPEIKRKYLEKSII